MIGCLSVYMSVRRYVECMGKIPPNPPFAKGGNKKGINGQIPPLYKRGGVLTHDLRTSLMNINILTHGQGTPLVFFHGWGFDAQIWLPLAPSLSNHQLHFVDLPGFGLTPPMPWETFKTTLLKQLPPTFTVIGWSMGGLLATKLAIEEPKRVRRLINISSTPYFIAQSNWPGIDLMTLKKFHQDLLTNPKQTLQNFITLQLQGQHVHLAQAPSLPGLSAGLEWLMTCDLRQDVSFLDLPVSYMFGRLDAIVPYRTLAIMQKSYPQFEYIPFSKSAHVPFLSHPHEFIAAFERVLS